MNRREERSLESIENLTNLQLYLRFWRLLLRRLVRHPLLPKNFPGAWWVLVIVCSPGVKRPPRGRFHFLLIPLLAHQKRLQTTR